MFLRQALFVTISLLAPIAAQSAVLFTSLGGIDPANPFVANSQADNNLGYNSAGADDFVVTGNGIRLDSVTVDGAYSIDAHQNGPAQSVNVYILGNSGGLPDTTNLSAGAIYAAENLSYSDIDSGDFFIPLPGSVTLSAGTYWLVVQANMNRDTHGTWGWRETSLTPNSGTVSGVPSAWLQSSNFGGPDCINVWGERVNTCGITANPDPAPPADRGLAFQLDGDVLTPGFILTTPSTLRTDESGKTASFAISLTAPPAVGAMVEVDLSTSDVTEGSVDTASVVFTAANYNIPQTVTVTGIDDAVADGDVSYNLVLDPAMSTDPGYSGLDPADYTATNQDNETAGILVNVSSVIVSEDGGLTATIDLSAKTPPTDDVSVPVSSSDTGLATLNAAAVILPSGSTSPVSVTVTGVNNDIDDGDLSFTITTGDPTSVGDAIYDAVNAAGVDDVNGTLLNDDVAGFLVSYPTGQPVQSDEAGTLSNSATIQLTSEPTQPVTINLFSADPGEGLPDVTSLMFDDSNWNSPMPVVLTGVEDMIADGTQPYNLVPEPAISSDPAYNGARPQFITAENLDSGLAVTINVDKTNIVVSEDGAITETIAISADTPPTADVTVPLSVAPPVASLSAAFVVLPSGSTAAQIITVTGIDDLDDLGDTPFTIVTGDPTSAGDAAFDALTDGDVPDVDGILLDNDPVAVPTLTPLALGLLGLALLLTARRRA